MKTILLSGGGTLGSVSPLLAIYEDLKRLGGFEFCWIGTKDGPERKRVEEECKIPYRSIPSGKLRRYLSVSNFFDPFLIFCGFVKSFFLLMRIKPSVIISAGGYVSVPLVWAGWILRIPSIIHQQDVRVGFANKLMAPCAQKITVTFERSYKYFGPKKAVITGNPCRKSLAGDREKAHEFFGFNKSFPTVFFMGGGTGAERINMLVFEALQDLVSFCQVIHSIGMGKATVEAAHPRYRGYEQMDTISMASAYAAADLVVCRAGMSSLTELSYLDKPTVLIPIPQSHQEENAYEFGKYNACEILNQAELDPKSFAAIIKDMLMDKPLMHELSRNIGRVMPKDANERVIQEIFNIIQNE